MAPKPSHLTITFMCFMVKVKEVSTQGAGEHVLSGRVQCIREHCDSVCVTLAHWSDARNGNDTKGSKDSSVLNNYR